VIFYFKRWLPHILGLLPVVCSGAGRDGQALNPLSLSLAPTGLLDINGAGIPVSLEYRFAERWSVLGEVNMPLLLTSCDQVSQEASVTRLHTDLRTALELHHFYYYRRVVAASWGIQGFFRAQEMSQQPGFYRMKGEAGFWQNMDYSYADIHKRIAGCALIFDARVLVRSRFSFSVMAGIGTKWSHTTHTNMQDPHIETPYALFGNPRYINSTFIDGEAWRIYFPVNLKLTYALVRSEKRP